MVLEFGEGESEFSHNAPHYRRRCHSPCTSWVSGICEYDWRWVPGICRCGSTELQSWISGIRSDWSQSFEFLEFVDGFNRLQQFVSGILSDWSFLELLMYDLQRSTNPVTCNNADWWNVTKRCPDDVCSHGTVSTEWFNLDLVPPILSERRQQLCGKCNAPIQT